MTEVEAIYLAICVVCVLASGFLSSAEIAFVSLQKVKLRYLEDDGVRGARRVARIMDNPGKFLSTVLTAISFTEAVVMALGSMLVVSLVGNEAIGTPVSIVVMAIVLLLFVKVIPKTLAANNPERLALRYADSVAIISKALSPVVSALSWLTDRVLRPVGGHTMPGTLLSKEEVHTAVSLAQEAGTVDGASADMLKKVLRIGDREVQKVMTPRAAVAWIEQGTNLAEFLKRYTDTPHPRYPVYKDKLANVKGIVATRDVLLALAKGSVGKESTVAGFVRPVHFALESKLVGELLFEMQDRKSEMAVIVDEQGSPSGIISVSQLAQEIMGEVRWTLADL